MGSDTPNPFRIKICGVTTAASWETVVASGADAVGLNFAPQSKRYLRQEMYESLLHAASVNPMPKVGVFVNAPTALIAEITATFDLDFIQLHGDEPAEVLKELATPVIRAIRISEGGVEPILRFLDACDRCRAPAPAAVLVDAFVPGLPGGTGKTLRWDALTGWRRKVGAGTRLILAGGLTPTNVSEAIRMVEPDGVDTASGVESSPGVKDLGLARRFVHAARETFDAVSGPEGC